MYKITINTNIDILIDNDIILNKFKTWLKEGVDIFEIENTDGIHYIMRKNIVCVKITKMKTKTVFNENFPIELETPNDDMTVINDNFDKEISDAICESIKEEE